MTSTSMTVSWTKGADADGTLLLMGDGAAPTEIPVDGFEYVAGDFIGTSKVVYSGGLETILITGLTAGHHYYFAAYSFKGSGGSINYKEAAPLQDIQDNPSAQPTSMTFTLVSSSSITVNWSHASPQPNRYLVVRKLGSAVDFVPSNGAAYSAGQDVGNGNVIVGYATGTSIAASGLEDAETYHFAVFSSNFFSAETYLAAAPLTGNQITLASEPTAIGTSLILTDAGSQMLTINFTEASPSCDGYLVAIRKGADTPSPTGPADGTPYNLGDSLGNSWFVRAAGAFSIFPYTTVDLGNADTYYVRIYSFNGSGSNINYRVSTFLSGSKVLA